MTTVTKEAYWQTIVNDPTQAGQIATDDAEWNTRAACLFRVLENTLIKRDNAILVQQWEHQLELSPAADASLADRKAACLYKMTCALPITPGLVEKALEKILGAGNFSLTRDTEENKVTVAVSLDTTEAQIAEIKSLLDRVLPSNLVTEIDEMPLNFERVEYFDTEYPNYVQTDWLPAPESKITMRVDAYQNPSITNGLTAHFCCAVLAVPNSYPAAVGVYYNRSYVSRGYLTGETDTVYSRTRKYNERIVAELDGLVNKIDGEESGETRAWSYDKPFQYSEPFACTLLHIPPNAYGYVYQTPIRIYSFEFLENDIPAMRLLPALDDLGCPCFFDTVGRKTFYNIGGGNFIYPGMETQATTYSLRNRMYAQLTEHGVRRLYHVPAGYDGSKEEYAAEHGFKILVETPMPEEGYCIPEWRETETQLILDWVETEAPAEEEISIC